MTTATKDHVIDLLLTGGRISTLAEPDRGPGEVQSIAIAGGAIHAVGSDAELASLAPLARRVIDLGGRRVLPGLIDSHIHAGASGVSGRLPCIGRACDRSWRHWRRSACRAAELPAGTWIPVIGGWHRRQFAEGRTPTPQELTAAAPNHPVYIQETYDFGFLNAAGLAACGWSGPDAQDPPRGSILRDESGVPTGVLLGLGAFAIPTAKASAVSREAATQGTRQMMREFASHGLSAVNDGGGLLVRPSHYDPLFSPLAQRRHAAACAAVHLGLGSWRRGRQLRVVYRARAARFRRRSDVGLGVSARSCTWGCHDLEGFEEFSVDESSAAELVEISRNARVARLADVDARGSERHALEHPRCSGRPWKPRRDSSRVDAGRSCTPMRRRHETSIAWRDWSSACCCKRHSSRAATTSRSGGSEATANAQPIAGFKARGMKIGLGMDATRANWFSPWASIDWFVSGRSIDGAGVRASEHLMTREDAIRAYTADAAWFTGEDDRRGKLLPGYLADLFVRRSIRLSAPRKILRASAAT